MLSPQDQSCPKAPGVGKGIQPFPHTVATMPWVISALIVVGEYSREGSLWAAWP